MSVDPYGKDSVQLAEEILKEFGLSLEKGKGLKPSKINNGGFPCDYSPYDFFRQCVSKTGCS